MGRLEGKVALITGAARVIDVGALSPFKAPHLADDAAEA